MTFIKKPWGREQIVRTVQASKCAFKVIAVIKGRKLSKQVHRDKKEVWLVVSGEPMVTTGLLRIRAFPGEIVVIHPGTIHRLEADMGMVTVWEMQCGEDSDIERLDDDYGRK